MLVLGEPERIEHVELQELINRSKQGDERARALLIEQFYPPLRDMVHRELSLELRRAKPWLAALFSTGDVVHDVIIGVLRNLGGFEGSDEKAFVRYLHTSVTHRLLDTIRFHEAARRDRRRVGGETDFAMASPSTAVSPIQAASRSEQARGVREALRHLTSRDRALLEMRFRRDAAYTEIAFEFGLPSAEAARKAIRTARARALMKLRARGIDCA